MPLVNTLTNTPLISSTSGKKKYVVDLANIVAGGDFATVDINLETYPAGSVLLASRLKHTTPVAGADFSAATARLFFGGTALGGAALDVFAAVGTTDGTRSIASTTPVQGDTEANSILMMRVTSTGGNLSAATAGAIEAAAEVLNIGL